MAVEKSRLELRICEYAVRSIASPISSTIAENRWVRTEIVTGSSMTAVYAASGDVGDPEKVREGVRVAGLGEVERGRSLDGDRDTVMWRRRRSDGDLVTSGPP